MDLPNYNCALCPANTQESVQHLFFQCSFAQQCCNLLQLHVSDPKDPLLSLESLKNQLNAPFFMDIVILLSWCIWMARGVQPSLQNCKDLPDIMSSWIDTML